MSRRPSRPLLVTRRPHRRLARLRGHRLPPIALFAVLGPGLLAGLSDDDPAGITTYSILGADHGYALLWVLAVSTLALIVFHELAMRTGLATGRGLMTLVRARFRPRTVRVALAALVIANVGTICAELAGVAVGMDLLTGSSRYLTVPFAAVLVSALVLRGSFARVEHVLLAVGAIFVVYVVAGVMAHPDWGAAGQGLVVPRLPGDRDGMLDVVATVGTTLAPWGLVFIQSYAVDKRLGIADLRYERIDVVVGSMITGVIGLFIVVACAATLHPASQHIDDASDAAVALRPLLGSAAEALFGLGLVGAALLAAAVVPLSTAYSIAEAHGRPADLNDRFADARLFYCAYGASMAVAVAVVLVPGAPLVSILVLTQALNAVLLLAILPLLRTLAADRQLMGEHRLGPLGRVTTALTIAVVAASVVVLGALTLA